MPRLPARWLLALFASMMLARPLDAQDVLPSAREAAFGAALLGGAMLLDRTFDGSVPRGGGARWEAFSDAANYGGRPGYAVLVLGGAWAAGTLTEERPVAEGALHVAAGLAAGGLVNGALKFVVGRERPSVTDDPARFHPFSPENARQSFPSGHAVVAFSLASSLAEEARSPWVTALSYGGASLVAWSRVYDDKHWTSDVVGGALIGIAAGRGAVRLLHRADEDGDPPTVAIAPGAVLVRIPVD